MSEPKAKKISERKILTADATLDEAIERFQAVIAKYDNDPDHAFAEIAAGLLILAREIRENRTS